MVSKTLAIRPLSVVTPEKREMHEASPPAAPVSASSRFQDPSMGKASQKETGGRQSGRTGAGSLEGPCQVQFSEPARQERNTENIPEICRRTPRGLRRVVISAKVWESSPRLEKEPWDGTSGDPGDTHTSQPGKPRDSWGLNTLSRTVLSHQWWIIRWSPMLNK